MATLKGSKTESNILTAFAGESQARNRYTYFASKAKNEGLIQISNIFMETAEQEKEHAKRLFKFLEGGDAMVTAAFPAGIIGTTVENLRASAEGEKHEYTEMYPEFAKIARDEGFSEVAKAMESIAVAEEYHEKRFLGFIENIVNDRVFKRDARVTWKCGNCGYIIESVGAPSKCPACDHEQKHFELLHNPWEV